MQKKKTAKSTKTKKIDTKRPAKTTNKQNATNHFGMLEKDFNDAPKKLVASLRKDMSSLKSQEKKLKSEVKKAQAQKKQAKNKRTSLAAKLKDKNNATNKKLFVNAKAAFDQVSKQITTITEQYNEVKAQVKSLTEKSNRYNALTKLLAQFEKQWALKAKKPNASKAKKKATKKAKFTQEAAYENNQTQAEQQSHHHAHESTDVEQNEPVEAAAK